jgi:hypothetical protein
MQPFPLDVPAPPNPRTLQAPADTAPLAAYFERLRARGK